MCVYHHGAHVFILLQNNDSAKPGRGYRHRRLAVREAWASNAQNLPTSIAKFILSEDERTPQVGGVVSGGGVQDGVGVCSWSIVCVYCAESTYIWPQQVHAHLCGYVHQCMPQIPPPLHTHAGAKRVGYA